MPRWGAAARAAKECSNDGVELPSSLGTAKPALAPPVPAAAAPPAGKDEEWSSNLPPASRLRSLSLSLSRSPSRSLSFRRRRADPLSPRPAEVQGQPRQSVAPAAKARTATHSATSQTPPRSAARLEARSTSRVPGGAADVDAATISGLVRKKLKTAKSARCAGKREANPVDSSEGAGADEEEGEEGAEGEDGGVLAWAGAV